MATFADQPSEFEYPYYDARVAYDNSLEAAINANETAADAADAKAVAAQSTADTALTNAATAQATADAALPVIPYTSNTDLDTLTTSGVYPSPWSGGTVALNFPINLNTGFLLEVFKSPTSSAVWQRLTPTVVPTRKGFWTRSKGVSTWSAWSFTPAQRVDNTAGRAIYTWDETANREQLIYGDTGWRDVMTLLGPNFVGASVQTRLAVRRLGRTVQLALRLSPSTEILGVARTVNRSILSMPAGFRPDTQSRFISLGAADLFQSALPGTINTFPGTNDLNVRFMSGSWVADELISANISFTTDNAWPTTLPGTAIGTIPHN